jgi:hypothetical protein
MWALEFGKCSLPSRVTCTETRGQLQDALKKYYYTRYFWRS